MMTKGSLRIKPGTAHPDISPAARSGGNFTQREARVAALEAAIPRAAAIDVGMTPERSRDDAKGK